MALFDILPVTVNISSSTTIQFNQTNISNVLGLTYTINTLGASVAGVTLEWKRSNESTWTSLTNNSALTSYTHTFTDTNFNTNAFNYKYFVRDTEGGTGQSTITITPAAYVAPTAPITQTATISYPESVTTREKGNTLTTISATITRQSSLVALTGFTFEFNANNSGNWISTGFSGVTNQNPSTWSTGTYQHGATGATSSVRYRIKVRDAYQDFINSAHTATTATTINFYNLIFYGPSGAAPTTANDIRNLEGKTFADTGTNPFILNTGITHVNFIVGIPDPIVITQVLDLEVSGANITPQYILSNGITLIPNYIGTNTNYNVYVMSNSIPYTENHRHQITRG
jgi:hypothetical protein